MSFLDYMAAFFLFSAPIFYCGVRFGIDLQRWRRDRKNRELGQALLNQRIR